jgi:hypothetical protein
LLTPVLNILIPLPTVKDLSVDIDCELGGTYIDCELGGTYIYSFNLKPLVKDLAQPTKCSAMLSTGYQLDT